MSLGIRTTLAVLSLLIIGVGVDLATHRGCELGVLETLLSSAQAGNAGTASCNTQGNIVLSNGSGAAPVTVTFKQASTCGSGLTLTYVQDAEGTNGTPISNCASGCVATIPVGGALMLDCSASPSGPQSGSCSWSY